MIWRMRRCASSIRSVLALCADYSGYSGRLRRRDCTSDPCCGRWRKAPAIAAEGGSHDRLQRSGESGPLQAQQHASQGLRCCQNSGRPCCRTIDACLSALAFRKEAKPAVRNRNCQFTKALMQRRPQALCAKVSNATLRKLRSIAPPDGLTREPAALTSRSARQQLVPVTEAAFVAELLSKGVCSSVSRNGMPSWRA